MENESVLDLGALQARLRRLAADHDWERFHTPKNLAMALAAEAGELLEIYQWMAPEESSALDDVDTGRVADEVADIAIYLTRLADVAGVDVSAAIERKLARDLGRGASERGWSDKR